MYRRKEDTNRASTMHIVNVLLNRVVGAFLCFVNKFCKVEVQWMICPHFSKLIFMYRIPLDQRIQNRKERAIRYAHKWGYHPYFAKFLDKPLRVPIWGNKWR
jgi:hypothetical protein